MSKALERTTSCLSLAIDPGIRSLSLGPSDCPWTAKIHQGQKKELLGGDRAGMAERTANEKGAWGRN